MNKRPTVISMQLIISTSRHAWRFRDFRFSVTFLFCDSVLFQDW